MRKLSIISLALIVAPMAFAACGGDDTAPAAPGTGGSAGSGTGGSAGDSAGSAGTSATGGGGSGTGGSAGTAGTAGTAGSAGTAGGGGTASAEGGTTEGGVKEGGASTEGGSTEGGSATDGGGSDANGTGGNSKCTTAGAMGEGDTCAQYCEKFLMLCNTAATMTANAYANQSECLTACNAFTQSQLCCRAYHVITNAATDAVTHCKHGLGMGGVCVN